jgi:hypothetical protein
MALTIDINLFNRNCILCCEHLRRKIPLYVKSVKQMGDILESNSYITTDLSEKILMSTKNWFVFHMNCNPCCPIWTNLSVGYMTSLSSLNVGFLQHSSKMAQLHCHV